MRRNKVAKRLGLASLCLATVASALSGIALLDNDVALAIGGKTEEPFSAVTAGSPHASLTYDGGVRLSSDAPYQETLNDVFKNDTTLKFTFPETFDMEGKWYSGDFTIRVSDADNENNYFDVIYYPQATKQPQNTSGFSYCTTRMVIKYNGLTRALGANQDKIVTTNQESLIVAPSFLTYYPDYIGNPTEKALIAGWLSFNWDENGVLSINTNSCATGNGAKQYTIVAFDGSYNPAAANQGIVWDSKTKTGSFGLPKLDFKDGYKISLLSNFTEDGVEDHATDVCIQEIMMNGTTVEGVTTYETSVNYSKYKNTKQITIFDRDNAYKTVEVGDELTIPAAIYDGQQEVIDVQVVRPNGKKTNVTPGKTYKVTMTGVHHVIYTVPDLSNESLAGFSFTAKEWTHVETTDFVHTSAEVTQEKNGVRITSDDAYQATFKSIFTGNTTFKFKFPETYTDTYYGDFAFRITDATDDSKYFDIKYYVASKDKANYTGVYVAYGDQVRQATHDGTLWYDAKQENTSTVAYAPSFLSNNGATYGERMGILSLNWTEDVLAIQANTGANSDETLMQTIAKFDGTNSFVDQESWGLPKLNLTNGYTITVSSSIQSATDVLFTTIESNNATYDLSTTNLVKDSGMQAFDSAFKALESVQTMKGKVFLGWRNTATSAIYPAYSVVRKVSGQSYDAVVMVFDTVDGAGVRTDASEGGKSGIRFHTYFNVDEYTSLKDCIQSFGTIVAWTDTLEEGKEFTYENYQGASAFAKVPNTKGTFAYTDRSGEQYTAYSMAVVDVADYTKEYSARGYFVAKYADGSTRTIYTDYNEADNSISLAAAAYMFKTIEVETYLEMSEAKKAIIDNYATAYVEPKN